MRDDEYDRRILVTHRQEPHDESAHPPGWLLDTLPIACRVGAAALAGAIATGRLGWLSRWLSGNTATVTSVALVLATGCWGFIEKRRNRKRKC